MTSKLSLQFEYVFLYTDQHLPSAPSVHIPDEPTFFKINNIESYLISHYSAFEFGFITLLDSILILLIFSFLAIWSLYIGKIFTFPGHFIYFCLKLRIQFYLFLLVYKIYSVSMTALMEQSSTVPVTASN